LLNKAAVAYHARGSKELLRIL